MDTLAEGLRYDEAATRQSVRRGRERGCWVFIPAAELRKAGIDPHGPAPKYRVRGRQRSANGNTAFVNLYR